MVVLLVCISLYITSSFFVDTCPVFRCDIFKTSKQIVMWVTGWLCGRALRQIVRQLVFSNFCVVSLVSASHFVLRSLHLNSLLTSYCASYSVYVQFVAVDEKLLWRSVVELERLNLLSKSVFIFIFCEWLKSSMYKTVHLSIFFRRLHYSSAMLLWLCPAFSDSKFPIIFKPSTRTQ